jgi:hypothetical protein
MQLEENNGTDAPKPEEPVMQPVNEGKTEGSAEKSTVEGKKEKPAGFKKMPVSKFQKIVNSITLALVCLVIGALAVLFGLYLPKLTAFNKAQAELARLTQVEADYTELQSKYSKTEQQYGVYKTISDTNCWRRHLSRWIPPNQSAAALCRRRPQYAEDHRVSRDHAAAAEPVREGQNQRNWKPQSSPGRIGQV